MASPPKAYPNDSPQGVAAFGRNYGAVLGRERSGLADNLESRNRSSRMPFFQLAPKRTTVSLGGPSRQAPPASLAG
jgi:hypothetical protein